jgi:2'-5' RNA ligase
VRLFLAIDPVKECRRSIATFIEECRGLTASIRWVNEEKLHITLAFLGDVHEAQLSALTESIRRTTHTHSTFTVRVDGGGAFPNWRRPRVVWLGLRDGDALQRLGDDIVDTCAALGFPSDHPFRPHLTIGRLKNRLTTAEQEPLRSRLTAVKTHHFAVTRVMLMRSDLGRGGSVYTELASFPLNGT